MEDLQSEQERVARRHHREKSELQALIQDMKNSVPKSDKRRRKQMHLEVARLQAEMEQKHQKELEQFQDNLSDSSDLDLVTEDLAKMDLENQPPCMSRMQRCDRRAIMERECQEMIAEEEMEHLTSFRREEEEKVAVILSAKHLEMKNIPADGHCMYRAIQDQLMFYVSVESLRSRTSKYMRRHMEEFLPFFSNPESEDGNNREDFLRYCDDIVCTPAWGGQLELRALSHVLKTPIEVIQAESPMIVIGEEYSKKPITLVFLHYACSIGEHYNSVKPITAGAVGGSTPRLF
ncbi:OTU domain-containing protein 6A [Sorex araneus]|uniref:OTU domain-containing protein 6A n=1 Tax=Sorex araneus TaxID=42254 RepID=UPI00033191B1|nr:OTU domain-containing protein 6A [Sorex araneus]